MVPFFNDFMKFALTGFHLIVLKSRGMQVDSKTIRWNPVKINFHEIIKEWCHTADAAATSEHAL